MDKTAVKHKPTTLSNEKLVELAQNGQNIEMVMNEAMRRHSISLFAELAKLPQIINVPSYTKWLLQVVSWAISQGHKNGAIKVLKSIFDHPSVNLSAYKPNMLVNLAVSDPDIFPIIFTAQSTPDEVNTTIATRLELTDTKKANYAGEKFNHSKITPNHNKWLASLIEYLKEGGSWNNAMSGTILVINRLRNNHNDQFITEMAQYGMHPHLATTMIDASRNREFGEGNIILKRNLNANNTAGMKIAQFLKLDDHDAAEIIPVLIGCIANEDMIPYFDMVFEKIKEKSQDQNFLEELLTTKSLFTDVAIFNIFWNHNEETKKFLLQKIPTLSYPVLTSEEGTQWINTILTDSQGESLIKLFPKDVLTDVALPPNIRERVEKIINPSRELSDAYQVIRDMYANNNDWYKTSEAHLKMVEAGIGSQIGMSMMSAIIAVMMGSAVWNAARHHQVDQQELQNNLNNPKIVEIVMDSYQDFSSNKETPQETSQEPPQEIVNQNAYTITAQMDQALVDNLKILEGTKEYQQAKNYFRNNKFYPYKDSRNKLTIGYGHLILDGEDFSNGISEQEAENMFLKDVKIAIDETNKLLTRTPVPIPVAQVIANMVFQMGPSKVLGFEKMWKALKAFDYQTAADEMLDSDWAKQTPSRAKSLANIVRQHSS